MHSDTSLAIASPCSPILQTSLVSRDTGEPVNKVAPSEILARVADPSEGNFTRGLLSLSSRRSQLTSDFSISHRYREQINPETGNVPGTGDNFKPSAFGCFLAPCDLEGKPEF